MTYVERTGSALKAEHRAVERVPTELRTIVQVKEGEGEAWKEVTRVTTVSKNGASFSLMRPCSVGRLVTLVMPLDPALRAYDHDKEVYPVMGIVQYCNAATVENATVYHVGVGFIGKNIPESFKTDPTQNYRIVGMNSDGLWDVTEVASQFKNRKRPRYWLSLPVTVSLIQREERSITREETVTRNIGASGASVVSELNAEIGDKVKFACPPLDFYAISVVRNRKAPKGEPPTLHLEFVDAIFPVERALAPDPQDS